LYAASLSICVLTVELQKLDAKATAWPTEDFLRIHASSENKQSIKAPLARIVTTGSQPICISSQEASQEKSRVSRQAKKFLDRFLQLACACANINCARIRTDSLSDYTRARGRGRFSFCSLRCGNSQSGSQKKNEQQIFPSVEGRKAPHLPFLILEMIQKRAKKAGQRNSIAGYAAYADSGGGSEATV
jgi:hypothetical protein